MKHEDEEQGFETWWLDSGSCMDEKPVARRAWDAAKISLARLQSEPLGVMPESGKQELPPLNPTQEESDKAYKFGLEVSADSLVWYATMVALARTVIVRERQLLAALIRTVEQGRAEEWISVEDRLPETDAQVWCWAGCNIIASCQYDRDKGGRFWMHSMRSRITHWRELASPPTVQDVKEIK